MRTSTAMASILSRIETSISRLTVLSQEKSMDVSMPSMDLPASSAVRVMVELLPSFALSYSSAYISR